MKKLAVAGVLVLSVPVTAVEIGLKLGNADIIWDDGDTTSLDLYAALYAESLSQVSPLVKAGPSVEIAYGKKDIGTFYCTGYGYCQVDLTYTAFELNAKAAVTPMPAVDLFCGGGVSYNRFGLDAKDLSGNPIGTLDDEYGTGFQVFGGAQATLGVFGIGVEYKHKWVSTDSIGGTSAFTLNLSLRF